MSDPRWTEDDDTIIEGRTTTLVHSGDEGQQFIEQADLGVTDLAWDDLVALVRGAGEVEQLRARLEAAEAVIRQARERDIERFAAAVHQAYLDTCDRLGWPVLPSNDRPYDELHEDSRELDRASVRAVLDLLAPVPDTGAEPEADPTGIYGDTAVHASTCGLGPYHPGPCAP